MFEDLELPDMERKILKEALAERVVEAARLPQAGSARRISTASARPRQRIKRQIARGVTSALQADEPGREADEPASPAERFPFNKSDLTYRRLRVDTREESNAVVVCIMDTSGSMDRLKKYLARSFFFLLYQFVCTKYQNTELVFIGHHTQAKEVTEDEFFHKGESGGTLISSGYNKALEIIQDRFHPAHWNVYAFHCSDGDNFDSRQRRGDEGGDRALRDLQPLRLRRDQADGLALLRELDARPLQEARRRQLPVGADRAARGHLARLQGLHVQGPRPGRRLTTMATELRDIDELYVRDFHAWAKEQAQRLREIEASRPNLPLDFTHLIDEVEELARRDVRATKSQLRRLIVHLLKLEYSRGDRPRRQWLNTVDNARQALDDVLSPSVISIVTPFLEQLFEDARTAAIRDLLDHDEPEAASALPRACPYVLDQLIDSDWYPTNRHGLTDDTP